MTRTPADGVNLEDREEMQERVDAWNKIWPARPIRDTPNECCKNIPNCECDSVFTPLTYSQLRNAVIAYVDNPKKAERKYGPIYEWNTSNITNMDYLFDGLPTFDFNINNWDVSNVTSMVAMFADTTVFNYPLSKWNVGKVTNMAFMFSGATAFTGVGLKNWDVRKVVNMDYMFNGATDFNPDDLSKWKTYSLLYMQGIFKNAGSFLGTGIGEWDVSKVIIFSEIFEGASVFVEDISGWDVSKGEYMVRMFKDAIAFNIDLNGWDVGYVVDIEEIFSGASLYTGIGIERWDVARVRKFTGAFKNAERFDTRLELWNIQQAENMDDMFNGAWLQGTLYDYDWTSRNSPSNWKTVLDNLQPSGFYSDGSAYNPLAPTIAGTYPNIDHNTTGVWQAGALGGGTAAAARAELETAIEIWMNNRTNAISTYGDINSWDVSLVEDMSFLLDGLTTFNSDIHSWEVEKVTNFEGMFRGCIIFNSDITEWVINTTGGANVNMKDMFNGASAFDQNLSGWDVSEVGNFSGMFKGTFQNTTVNEDWTDGNTSTWNGVLTNLRAGGSGAAFVAEFYANGDDYDENVYQMTSGRLPVHAHDPNGYQMGSSSGGTAAAARTELLAAITAYMNDYDNAVVQYGHIATWDVSLVEDFSYLFLDLVEFNENISSWDVSNGTTFKGIFKNCKAFNHTVEDWDVSNGTDFSEAFMGCTVFNQVFNWDTTNATTMNSMFYDAVYFNQNINFNTTNLTDVAYMLNDASSFDGGFGINFACSSVTSMSHMLNHATNFNSDLINLDTANVTDMSYMLSNCSSFNHPSINSLDTSSVTNLDYTFYNTESFNQSISSLDVTSVTSMQYTFSKATAFDQDLSSLDTSSVVSLQGTFSDATQFNSPVFSNTSSVTDMSYTFKGATLFNQTLNWDTSNVTTLQGTFESASAFNNNSIVNWRTTSLTNLQDTFKNAVLFNQDISTKTFIDSAGTRRLAWEASKVVSMEATFSGASAFDQNLTSWDISSTTSVSNMFNGAFTSTTTNINWTRQVAPYYSPWKPRLDQLANSGEATVIQNFHSNGTEYTKIATLIGANPIIIENPQIFKPTPDPNSDPTGRTALKNAVDAWIADQDNARSIYGEINTWDTSLVTDMSELFKNTTFNSIISNWNTSRVTTMKGMFQNATQWWNFYGGLNTQEVIVADGTNYTAWDVSLVHDMSYMFDGATSLVSGTYGDAPSNWDTHNVRDMSYMFRNTPANDWDISRWRTHHVTNMQNMFQNATNFNQNLNSWDITSVTDVSNMFNGAFAPTTSDNNATWASVGSPSNWESTLITLSTDPNKVANFYSTGSNYTNVATPTGSYPVIQYESASGNLPFTTKAALQTAVDDWCAGGTAYNTVRTTYGEIGTWTFDSSLKDMSGLFAGKTDFNSDITGWDVSNVTDMSEMFSGAHSFNQNLSGWVVSNVTDMEGMFKRAYSFFGDDITGWDVTSVTSMKEMFYCAHTFDQNLNNWVPSSVTNFEKMFAGAFTQGTWELISWDLAADANGDWTINNTTASSWKSYLDALPASAVKGFYSIKTESLEANPAGGDYNSTQGTPVGYYPIIQHTSSGYLFKNNNELRTAVDEYLSSDLDIQQNALNKYGQMSTWNTEKITDMSELFKSKWTFNENINTWNVSKVTDMSEMFFECRSFTQNLNLWDVRKVTDMSQMFRFASKFTGAGLSGWQTLQLTSMTAMFNGTLFDEDISGWDVSKVTNMTELFKGTRFSHDINQWDTGNVTAMQSLFLGCNNFNPPSLNNWNVSKVTAMPWMFNGCTIFNGDISQWNTSSLINVMGMFINAKAFNQDLVRSGDIWNTSNLKVFSTMFEGATSFNGNIDNWDTSSGTDMGHMFDGATSFNRNISTWDTSKIRIFGNMFEGASSFNQNLVTWDVSEAVWMSNMFQGTAISGNWQATNPSKASDWVDRLDYLLSQTTWQPPRYTAFYANGADHTNGGNPGDQPLLV